MPAEENNANPKKNLPSNIRPENLWQPGQSGNPSGRPKKSEEEKALQATLMEGIRSLGEDTIASIKKIINPDNKCQAMARVKMIEIILAYILGKPSSEVKLSVSADEMAKDSEIRIAALIQAVRGGKDLSGGYDAIIEAAEKEEAESMEDQDNVES